MPFTPSLIVCALIDMILSMPEMRCDTIDARHQGWHLGMPVPNPQLQLQALRGVFHCLHENVNGIGSRMPLLLDSVKESDMRGPSVS